VQGMLFCASALDRHNMLVNEELRFDTNSEASGCQAIVCSWGVLRNVQRNPFCKEAYQISSQSHWMLFADNFQNPHQSFEHCEKGVYILPRIHNTRM
jgi:hypothetical protein